MRAEPRRNPAGGADCPHRRENAAARSRELLVTGTAGPQLELVHPIAREARMRVTVDQPRQRAEASPVELLDLTVERLELSHAAEGGDSPVLAEDVRILEHVDSSKRLAAKWRAL